MVRTAVFAAGLLASASGLRMESAPARTQQGEPIEKCPWRTQYPEDMCQWMRRDVAFNELFKSLRVPRWGIKNMSTLMTAVWDRLGGDPMYRNDFFEAFDKIKELQAADVFAFKETWTYRDTDHLKYIVYGTNYTGMDKTAELTDELAISRFPNYKDFKRMLHLGDIAMVGEGPGLVKKKLGDEIDDHLQVVRFNSINASELHAETTGLKHNVHVVNSRMAGRQDAFLFDLDGENFLRSYCQRLFEGGEFPQNKGTYLFMWTPTAWCKNNNKLLWMFSREFLYYWFVGSLTNDVSLYGFVKNGTATHFNAPRFQRGEQVVYEEVAKQWQAVRASNPEKVSLNRRGKVTAGLALRS
mmetsp:Transcript_19495/g.53015  ORF Transcript_19495/g.53015 Transcript_19495/m.53015 type:complete len:355 (-) Transcript_19495:76-1140(-)